MKDKEYPSISKNVHSLDNDKNRILPLEISKISEHTELDIELLYYTKS